MVASNPFVVILHPFIAVLNSGAFMLLWVLHGVQSIRERRRCTVGQQEADAGRRAERGACVTAAYSVLISSHERLWIDTEYSSNSGNSIYKRRKGRSLISR